MKQTNKQKIEQKNIKINLQTTKSNSKKKTRKLLKNELNKKKIVEIFKITRNYFH